MSEKKLASDYFMEGLNCAESVIKAYNEEFGTDIPIRVASGLGGGCAVGNLCGKFKKLFAKRTHFASHIFHLFQ